MSTLASLRHWARTSPHPAAAVARRTRGAALAFTLPAPRVLVRPYLWLFLGMRGTLFFLRRVLVAEPLFKAYCARVGRGVTTGIHVPWVQGSGELVVGDHVRVSGKISISYAASFTSRPRLEIGDYSDIAHETRFVVGREIRLGRHVQVAGGVTFRDSGGHPTDPERRRLGSAPDPDDVKPVIVHDHAWIGTGALVMPGTEIGEGAIVSAHAVVSGKVAPYSIVAGNPARRIGMVGQAAPGAAAATASAAAA
ncbi:acyltransferase [Luteimonas sp. MC1750]|uniref:acyltransferase n=1 Tax=Luteimonas sp. MC1750 TaxID=2799326 RepID=UPI0018F0C721|nr:acyltransferase [Luteimonas sp. MC1750]MBJ6984085.1 acyltransferase [Luteimonas sp. MC1750]QQO06893.1 acyltransferase [Luteimonas sp. MC1750]